MENPKLYLDAMGSFVSPETKRDSLPPVNKYLDMYSRGMRTYPVQSTLLKIIFLETEQFTDFDRMVIDSWMHSTVNGGEVRIQLDLYERMKWCKAHGYKHFANVINCCGRRGGKGFVGARLAEYLTAQLISLGSPQRYYGVDTEQALYLDVFATSYSQAQTILYRDVYNGILNDDYLSPYIYHTSRTSQSLQTPSDKLKEEGMLRGKDRHKVTSPFASVNIQPFAITSNGIRGQTSYLQMYDEFAFGGDTSKISIGELYEAATPSLTTLGEDGMIYIPSSPWSQSGKFYELFQKAFEMDNDGKAVNPTMFAIQWPSWAPYEWWEYDIRHKGALILPPEKSSVIKLKENQNPEKFNVEYRANFAAVEEAYMNPHVIDSLFEPFPKEGENRNRLTNEGNIEYMYRAHADAGRSQDNFCFALGHREKIDGTWHAFIDVMKTWQHMDFPEDENGVRKVDYTVVLSDLEYYFKHFGVYKYTMDQWNSAYILDRLKQEVMDGQFLNPSMEVSEDTHNGKDNMLRWEAYKTACYQGWVHIPWLVEHIHKLGKDACLVEREMKFMINKDGKKITWPTTTAIRHGDMVDATSTVVVDLLADQLNYDIGDSASMIVGTAQGGYNNYQADALENQQMSEGEAYMRSMGWT